MKLEIINKKIILIIIVLSLMLSSVLVADGASKRGEKTAKFVGIHSDAGASVWGVNFVISLNYIDKGSFSTATGITTSATMYPKHTFGVGDVIIAGITQIIDFNDQTSRPIRPIKSSFWETQSLIVPTGTHVYYSYSGTMDETFRYGFEAKGNFTFAVPDVVMLAPNTTLNVSVSTSH